MRQKIEAANKEFYEWNRNRHLNKVNLRKLRIRLLDGEGDHIWQMYDICDVLIPKEVVHFLC